MAEDSGCAKWGCGCLSVILVLYGIPAVMVGLRSFSKTVVSTKDRYVANVERWRSERKAKADSERIAKEQAETAARIEAERMNAEAERARAEAERKAAHEAKMKFLAEKEDRLRSFAIKEAPVLWKTYQDLGVQIDSQGRNIEVLKGTLLEFDKDPEQDVDFKAICAMRDEMIGVRASLRRKIEDAYFAFRKFEATPSRKDYDELRRKTLEDGVQEAMSAKQRFDIMRKEK